MEAFVEQFISLDTDLSCVNTNPNYAENFKLPIEYLDESVYPLTDIVVKDLELVESQSEESKSMYECVFSPKNGFSKQVIPNIGKNITTNIEFLEESQHIITSFYDFKTEHVNSTDVEQKWSDVKHNPKFYETYGYAEWEMLKEYNYSSWFLQTLSVLNMMSPIMSFFIPLLFMIFPFFILKMQGVPITFSIYFEILKNITKHHFIGRLLTTWDHFSIENFIYLLATTLIYGIQLYQNTTFCLRFYKNTQKVNDDLIFWKKYIPQRRKEMEEFVNKYSHLSTYKLFCENIYKRIDKFLYIENLLEPIESFKCSISKATEIGHMLKVYYIFHTDDELEDAILFSMGFNGYIHLLKELCVKYENKTINCAQYEESSNVVKVETIDTSGNEEIIHDNFITKQCYPIHSDEKVCVENDVYLDEFGVITGPNASGKTTFLKTTLINIILSQQIGFGFFEKCRICPYTHIHSYLNIPDTSGRDSLFQSESRRCKEILDCLDEYKEGYRHFCILDELYSGTNPNEATKAAHSFLEYLRTYKNVDVFLTTHYTSICEKWDKNNRNKKKIVNLKMIVNEEENTMIPTYKITTGISHLEGAIHILQDMNYPEEIINGISMK